MKMFPKHVQVDDMVNFDTICFAILENTVIQYYAQFWVYLKFSNLFRPFLKRSLGYHISFFLKATF